MKGIAAFLTVVVSLAAPAITHAAPPIARPNPAVYPVRLDYENPLASPTGGPATLAPLRQAASLAATRDQAYLAFGSRDDLGGFVPAPIGRLALSGGGRDIVLPRAGKPQIPLFSRVAGGKISSYTFRGAIANPSGPPDNGKQRIPGIGPPPPVPAPTGGNTIPPANQGFGGRPTGNGGGKDPGPSTTTTSEGTGGGGTVTRPRPPTTTTGTFTTTAGTLTLTTTRGGGGSSNSGAGGGTCSGGSCAAGSCGVPGIQVDSVPPGCVIALSQVAPGDSVSEVMTITNTSDTRYALSVKAEGANNNHLWQDLELGIWQVPGPPPASLPSLSSWLLGFSSLITLNPGDSVQYEIELYLPTTAGNADQGKTAVVAFHWRAQG